MIKILNSKKKKLVIFFLIINVFMSYFFFISIDFSFQDIKKYHQLIKIQSDNDSILYFSYFFIIYFIITAFAVPVAAIFSILIGSLFGFYKGVILVSFASSLGSLSCFLLSRYIFSDYIQKKFNKKLTRLNKKIEEDGLFYLFIVRMTPVIPFFLVNILFGLTKIKASDFYIISQLGMLISTCIFVNAGYQMASVDSIEKLFSIKIIASLFLLGLFPLAFKKIIILINKIIFRN